MVAEGEGFRMGEEGRLETYCDVCEKSMAGEDDMCPNRDNVCVYCCLMCWPDGKCNFTGDRSSREYTLDHNKGYPEDVGYA